MFSHGCSTAKTTGYLARLKLPNQNSSNSVRKHLTLSVELICGKLAILQPEAFSFPNCRQLRSFESFPSIDATDVGT